MDDDKIPSRETYRDVPIHSGQNRKRVATVKQAIDRVHETTDPATLFVIAMDTATPPEARVAAGNRLLAPFNEATGSRQTRPRGLD